MANYTKSITDNTKDKEKHLYKIHCEECLNTTLHKALFSIGLTEQSEYFLCWTDFQIIQCQGCHSISFRKNYQNPEDVGHYIDSNDEYHEELIEHVTIYPPRMLGRKQIEDTWLLPPNIANIYKETCSAISNDMAILSGIGMRALIEAICKEKNSTGKNLEKKIDYLVENGIITQDGADILHTVRDIGNESAHQIKQQDKDTINIAMDIVEHILKSVYILPKIAERIKK